jgi:acyl carrier protein
MSERTELSRRIFKILETMNLEVPSADTDLFQDGLLDSLTFVELLVKLEEELGASISLDDLEPDNFRSVDHIASFIMVNHQFAKSATGV